MPERRDLAPQKVDQSGAGERHNVNPGPFDARDGADVAAKLKKALSDLADAATRGVTGRSRGLEVEMVAINIAYVRGVAYVDELIEEARVFKAAWLDEGEHDV